LEKALYNIGRVAAFSPDIADGNINDPTISPACSLPSFFPTFPPILLPNNDVANP
jgi:hypothetical protein